MLLFVDFFYSLELGNPGKGQNFTGNPRAIFFLFWQFFSTCEKITQFLRCGKYQGGKIQVRPFGFLLQIF